MTDRTKKAILWSITLIVAILLLILLIKDTKTNLDNFHKEEFIAKINFPKIEVPKTEIPLGELKELIKNAEEAATTTTE